MKLALIPLLAPAVLIPGAAAQRQVPGPSWDNPVRGTIAWSRPGQRPEDPLLRLIPALMASAGIPGVSVARIEGGRVVWARGFGVRESGREDPVDTLTIFEGASFTKPIVAAGVLRMVGRGEFQLDRPLHEYLAYPDIESDPRYRRITARMVLSHTTGFPNWRGNQPLRIEFEPGSRYGYSGEGFVYLQRVIEHVTGEPLAQWAEREVLGPLGMTQTSLVWEVRFQSNLALPHSAVGRPMRKGQPDVANAAWSVHTTASDLARFLLALREGPLLDDAQRRDMLTPQVTVKDRLSWGLGIGLQDAGDSLAIWHWGDNTGYKSFGIVQLRSGEGLVYLSNSDHGMSIVPDILEEALGSEQPALRHLDYERWDAPRRLVRLALDSAMMAGGPARGIPRYHQLKQEYPDTAFDVELLQDIARLVIRAGFVENAVQLLELNAAEYPNEWSAHSSLGDAYARLDRTADAIASYERALELNPDLRTLRAKLEELRSRR